MKHRIGFNRLGRKPAHRKSLHRNMVTSLFKYERIQTTKAKAREIRRTAEKMITRAKIDSVHNRRMVGRDIKDKAILAKLFVDIAPRFKTRPGGYTRMLKIGPRQGDAAEMVLLELVEEEMEEAPKSKKSSKKSGSKPESKKSEARSKASDKKSAKAEKVDETEAAVDVAPNEGTGEATADSGAEAAADDQESTEDQTVAEDESAAAADETDKG